MPLPPEQVFFEHPERAVVVDLFIIELGLDLWVSFPLGTAIRPSPRPLATPVRISEHDEVVLAAHLRPDRDNRVLESRQQARITSQKVAEAHKTPPPPIKHLRTRLVSHRVTVMDALVRVPVVARVGIRAGTQQEVLGIPLGEKGEQFIVLNLGPIIIPSNMPEVAVVEVVTLA